VSAIQGTHTGIGAVRSAERPSAATWLRWVVRSRRAVHPDPSVRKNVTFRLPRVSGKGYFSPAEISQLESEANHRTLTVAHLRNYEEALQIRSGSLTDLYHYLARNRSTTTRLESLTDDDMDNVQAVIAQQDAPSSAWILTAQAVATGQIRLGPKTRARLARHLIATLKSFSGYDYRVVREAALVMGNLLVEELDEELSADSAHAFHLIEPLGFLPPPSTRRIIDRLAHSDETWATASVLEAYTRQLLRHPDSLETGAERGIRDLVERFLLSADVSVQQQAAQLARVALPHDGELNLLLAAHPNLDVRRPLEPGLPAEDVRVFDEIVDEILAKVHLHVRLRRPVTPLVKAALFASDRTMRSESAWILQASGFGEATSVAIWSAVRRHRHVAEELQRALVRFGGRVGGVNVAADLIEVACDPMRPPTVRAAALWDVPGVVVHGTEPSWLLDLYSSSTDRLVRRASVTAAGAISHAAVLELARRDADATVRSEARRWA
jgi:hypothetical protein